MPLYRDFQFPKTNKQLSLCCVRFSCSSVLTFSCLEAFPHRALHKTVSTNFHVIFTAFCTLHRNHEHHPRISRKSLHHPINRHLDFPTNSPRSDKLWWRGVPYGLWHSSQIYKGKWFSTSIWCSHRAKKDLNSRKSIRNSFSKSYGRVLRIDDSVNVLNL